MKDFCPLINGKCNRECVFLLKAPSFYGLKDYCGFTTAIYNLESKFAALANELTEKQR